MSTDQETISWYDQHADEYQNSLGANSIYHSLYEKPAIYAELPDLHHKTVLSLGCGSGEDSNYLKMQGSLKSVGVDISAGLIKLAQKTYPDCQFSVMDIEKLEFDDQSFDFAFSSLVMHYLEDWTIALREINRVLKPGSTFIFSTFHPTSTSMLDTELNSTREVRQLGMVEDHLGSETTVFGNYLSPRRIKVSSSNLEVTAWHKPLSVMSQSFNEAEFLIEKIIEPTPLPQMKDISPSHFEKLSKIPRFIIFRLIKK